MKKIQKNQLALVGGLFLAGLLSAYAPAGAPSNSRTAASAITARSAGLTAKRATREGWEGTIRWMQQTQGLGNLGSDEKPILDYLAKHYAPKQEGRRPALKNIDWYPLNH